MWNRYALQMSTLDPSQTNGRADWFPTDEREILCWFGCLILMGLKDLPNHRLYWSPKDFYGCPVLKSCITRARFEALVRCVHLVNNARLPGPGDAAHDKIGKARWLIEEFTRISQAQYHCERICTVDEVMVPYKGRFCTIRQYMKAKPCKFGIKIWALASSRSRYVSNLIVYLGAAEVRELDELVGANAVLTAVRGLEGLGHVIVTDNYFTSVKLSMELLAQGFYTTGTVKKLDIKGFSILSGRVSKLISPGT